MGTAIPPVAGSKTVAWEEETGEVRARDVAISLYACRVLGESEVAAGVGGKRRGAAAGNSRARGVAWCLYALRVVAQSQVAGGAWGEGGGGGGGARRFTWS